jgi:hypothetical protein
MNTLDLELRKSKTNSEGYEVELLQPSTNQSPVIEPLVIPYDADKQETQELLEMIKFDEYKNIGKPSKIILEKPYCILQNKIGKILFDVLFTGQIFDYYEKVLNPSIHLNIRLHTTEPRLLNIPWEYMYDSKIVNGFLTIKSDFDISLTRLLKLHPQSDFSDFATPTDLPIRVLVVISKPRHSSLHFEERIEKAWLDKLSSNTPKRLAVDYIENPASFSKLEEKLTENSYDVLHFLGHGELKDENGVLLFEDNNEINDRETEPVTGERLAKALANQKRLKFVFLNSCFTGRNLGKPFSSVATALLKNSRVLSVVAMQFKIADEVGSTFAARFYHNLSVGKTIDEAISAARRSVYSEGLGEKQNKEIYETQWGIPVCYTQYDKPFQLVNGQMKSKQQKKWAKKIGVIAAFFTIFAFLTGWSSICEVFFSNCSNIKECTYAMRIFDVSTEKPIRNAKISFNYGIELYVKHTDSEGYSRFNIPCIQEKQSAKVKVDASGYESYNRVFNLLSEIEEIYLKPKYPPAISDESATKLAAVMVRAKGIGFPSPNISNPTIKREMAKRAAELDAKRQLAAQIKTAIESVTIVKDKQFYEEIIETRVNATLKSCRLVEGSVKENPDGSVEVVMEAPIVE